MPPSCSTTVPSIASRVRSRSRRIPFCVMICQSVSASENGITPTIASAIPGCCDKVATRAKLPVSKAGTNSRNVTRRNRTNPSTLRLIRP